MGSHRVFFLTTDCDTPSGGRWFIYQAVDMLVRNGIDASALHQKRGFRYSWFHSRTPTAYTHDIVRARSKTLSRRRLIVYALSAAWSQVCTFFFTKSKLTAVSLGPSDLLILPENRQFLLQEKLGGCMKILLVQGPYLLSESAASSGHRNPIAPHHILATSELCQRASRSLYPKAVTHLIPLFIDCECFRLREEKVRQIAYMPRRLPEESTALIKILRSNPRMPEIDYIPIDGCSRAEVSRILQDSLIFLSFSHREGFGLPAAEAMACGCLVIGYTGEGGDEFFTNETGFPVQSGDLQSFAQTTEAVVTEYSNDPKALDSKRRRAAALIRHTYCEVRTEAALLASIRTILPGAHRTE